MFWMLKSFGVSSSILNAITAHYELRINVAKALIAALRHRLCELFSFIVSFCLYVVCRSTTESTKCTIQRTYFNAFTHFIRKMRKYFNLAADTRHWKLKISNKKIYKKNCRDNDKEWKKNIEKKSGLGNQNIQHKPKLKRISKTNYSFAVQD